MKDAKIHIVGAGVSGLIAARNLEEMGYAPTILESADRPGGRVQTDIVNGYQLDRGFQVLLDAYPMAKKYLDYERLDLQKLSAGALIFTNGKSSPFGDPLRDASFLLPTVFSKSATLKDKTKIFMLKQDLSKRNLAALFEENEETTLAHLKGLGFSDRVIQNFFRPFFSGIFLEPDLHTSHRMFSYVYKLFGEGDAVIPKGGIGAISEQLVSALKNTTIQYNQKVREVMDNEITLTDGTTVNSDFVIVATDPSKLIANYVSTLDWKACDNLYFTAKRRVIDKPIIGLNTTKDALVNNIFYPSSIRSKISGPDELLSVTIVREHHYSKEELIGIVKQELSTDFGIDDLNFLEHYRIDRALPQLNDLQYSRDDREMLLMDHVALAGDHHLNGSLNAAMVSGEAAARIANQVLEDALISFG